MYSGAAQRLAPNSSLERAHRNLRVSRMEKNMTQPKFLPIPVELYLKKKHETTFRTPSTYLADCSPGEVSPPPDEPDDIADLITRNGF